MKRSNFLNQDFRCWGRRLHALMIELPVQLQLQLDRHVQRYGYSYSYNFDYSCCLEKLDRRFNALDAVIVVIVIVKVTAIV